MKMTDGKRTVEIEMRVWEGTRYSQDYSSEFFEAGGLPYDDETDTYQVKDVDYCIDMARDSIECKGDFVYDEPLEGTTLFVCDEIVACAPGTDNK